MQAESLIGAELAGYRLTKLLGVGASAWVYRGENVIDASIVRAIKVITPTMAKQPGFLQRVSAEARNLERLRHPGIVQFYGVRSSSWQGQKFLLMELEYLRGRTMRGFASRSNVEEVSVRKAVAWTGRAALAVGFAHQMGVVHRDLKPENVFVSQDSSIKVLDFGIARVVGEARDAQRVTQAGMVAGTAGYMAPEVCKGQQFLPASDVYALGMILYEMLVGRHPFVDERGRLLDPGPMTLAQMERAPAPIESLRAGVPHAVVAVVRRCLEKDASRRYPHAGALAVALDEIERSLGGPGSVGAPMVAAGVSSIPPVVAQSAWVPQAPVGVPSVGWNGAPSVYGAGPPSTHGAGPPQTFFAAPQMSTKLLPDGNKTSVLPGWAKAVAAVGAVVVGLMVVSAVGQHYEFGLPRDVPPPVVDAGTPHPCGGPNRCVGGNGARCVCRSGLICNDHTGDCCNPNCEQGRCGYLNDCGQLCGCSQDHACVNQQCECIRTCQPGPLACGDDGCGGRCGDCARGRDCVQGSCRVQSAGNWSLVVTRASMGSGRSIDYYIKLRGANHGSLVANNTNMPRWDWLAGSFAAGTFGSGVELAIYDDGIAIDDLQDICLVRFDLNSSVFAAGRVESSVRCTYGSTLYFYVTPN